MIGATGGRTVPGSATGEAGDAASAVIAELQRALLPTALPVLPEAVIAARYLVAGQDRAAGGDWFDAIALPDGRVALVVGDVVGHGVAATAAMAQLRAVLNELLLAERGLDVVLERTDAFARRMSALRAATLVLVVLDPASGGIDYATCGHPPPLVVSAARSTRFLPSAPGGPLGTSGPPVLAHDQLAPGDLLLLYSDGLVERPGHTLADGLVALAAAASDAADSRPPPEGEAPGAAERVCQLTVEHLTRAGYADDVTALAVERLARPVPEVHLSLTADVASLTAIRRAVRDWMAAVSPADGDQDDVHMAVVEVVTNAIEHAYAGREPGPVDFDLVLKADSELECVVSDYGTWHPPDPAAADRGNGLMVAEHMTDRMTITHPADAAGAPVGAPSTVVRLIHRLSRPATLASQATSDSGPFPVWTGFEVDATLRAGTAVARVRGPVDITTADEFLRRLLAACRGGTLPLVLDLTTVNCLASAGVSALFRLSDQISRHKNLLDIVAGRGSHVADVLRIVGLRFSEPPAARANA